MKKRTETDWIKQGLSSKRSLKTATQHRKYNRYKHEIQKKVFSRSVIVAPQALSFFEKNYDEFAKFLKDLHRLSASGKILIDLGSVRSAKAAAILVLYANIEQIQRTKKDYTVIKTIACKSSEISILFRTFGIWRLTGESRIRPQKSQKDSIEISTMNYASSKSKDKKSLRAILKYAQASVSKTGMHEGSLLAYNAITESISNVWQHAYDDEFFSSPVPEELRNWWIIVQCIEDQFFIAMYDIGAGIPKTISTKPWAAALIEAISSILDVTGMKVLVSPDAKSIKAAVDYGKSRFKQDNRGKGLTEAKDFVQQNPKGSLLIFSGLGHYEYRTEGDEEKLETLGSQFRGTLIQWNIKLETKNEA